MNTSFFAPAATLTAPELRLPLSRRIGDRTIQALDVTDADRILIFAPHPDDEALATGGLIQRAVAAGADVRVIFATNGDANPWPQRALYRRWRITAADRATWGSRRQREAIASMRSLGLSADSLRFLGIPDQGVAQIAASRDSPALEEVAEVIADFSPTILVLPSPRDRHPDHGGVFSLVRSALARLDFQSHRELHYLIHTRERVADYADAGLELLPAEQAVKRRAIAMHESQMMLSRKRFLAHAREIEAFEEVTVESAVPVALI